MGIRVLTGTALLLALALLSQSLRLFIPMSPQISMFLIGSLVSACLVIATWRYGVGSGLIIAWITPFIAFTQGMLPFIPFIPIVALGSSVYVLLAGALKNRHVLSAAVWSAIGKAVVLYGGFTLLFQGFHVPLGVQTAILFSMGWPQIVTGIIGVLLAAAIWKRLAI